MSRPPLPPFSEESAIQKVRAAEDAWNTRDPARVALAYTLDSRWRNRAEFPRGRAQIEAFLTRKWARELDYRHWERDRRLSTQVFGNHLSSAEKQVGVRRLPPTLYWRSKQRYKHRRLCLCSAQPGFAPAPAAYPPGTLASPTRDSEPRSRQNIIGGDFNERSHRYGTKFLRSYNGRRC